MLLARQTGTGLVCHESTATPVIHVVNVACETDWHRTCLSRKHGHTGHSRGECCLRDGLAQDLFVTQARPHRHSRGECCLRDGLAQDLFVTQARPHRFIHVVNVACETDWTGLVRYASTATPIHSRGECCLRDGLAQDSFVTQARPHRSFTW